MNDNHIRDGAAQSDRAAETIRILHLSDLHISEGWEEDHAERLTLPHRAGHDREVFLTLDRFLRNQANGWDLILLSGDLTRVGDDRSVRNVYNWISNQLNIHPQVAIGLNGRGPVVTVPGNHDRYAGGLRQGARETPYSKWFGEPKMVPLMIKGHRVRVHCFDTSHPKGGFGRGRIDPVLITAAPTEPDGLDIAMLHHHFLEPPHHKRERKTELDNGTQVARAVLGKPFHLVAFGHTHRSFLQMMPVRAVAGIVSDRRVRGRLMRWLLPSSFAPNDSLLTSYPRRSCVAKGGQRIAVPMFFRYLYLKGLLGSEMRDPGEFDSARHFYEYLEAMEGKAARDWRSAFEESFDRRQLISMAPSACQAEAEKHGFHEIEITMSGGHPKTATCTRYKMAGGTFAPVDQALPWDYR